MYLNDQFGYNKTPIVPPGIKVLARDNPAAKGTWNLDEELG